ncbi:MAG: hypothetical protein M1827_006504 [Pycnora praestabilis]|nr:MAG: hypothetical protein M1827_006504 [Pycnora praestabilis]
MPTYAILGATGQTGQALLSILLQSPDKKINAYVRSAARLKKLRPEISTQKNVSVFEGSLTNIPLITTCIRNTTAIFAVVASNENEPGLTVAQDTAQTIVAALANLRTQDPTAKIPHIIVLSSASCNPQFSKDVPRPAVWLLHTALSNVYHDLERAEAYLRLHESWLTATFIQPGALVHDAQKGHELNLDRIGGTFLSYLDLAAGMVEVADEGQGRYDWRGVCVVPTGKDVAIEWKVPFVFAKGLLWHFVPPAYWLTKALGGV